MARHRLFTFTCFATVRLATCGGGGGAWFKHEYEYDYIEAVMLISLVILALAFEMVYHHFWHRVQHSYRYGQIHEEVNHHQHKKGSHGNLTHPRLLKELFRRMSGEFMTLGFLALTIFTCNQFELFDFVGKHMDVCSVGAARLLGATPVDGDYSSDCWHFPISGSDWLHMAEVVHVKLFLAMVFYFALMFRVALSANERIEEWERLRLRRVWLQQQGEDAPPAVDSKLEKFSNMRDYLLKNLMLWKDTRRTLCAKLLFNMSAQLEGFSHDKKMSVLLEKMDKRLSMSAYLAFHVECGIGDSIEVKVPAWMGIFFIFGTYAVLGRYAKVELSHYVPFFVFLCLLFVLFMHVINRMQQRSIDRFTEQHKSDGALWELLAEEASKASGDTHDPQDMTMTISQLRNMQERKWYQRFNVEKNALHLLQVVLFFLTYTLAEALADKHKWKDRFHDTLVFALVYLVIYMLVVAVVPNMLPIFLQFTALPPFLHEANINMLLHVLLDDHAKEEKRERNLNSHPSEATVSLLRTSDENREFAAVVELADVIGQCHDFEQLACVRQTLEERMGIKPAKERMDIKPAKQILEIV